jgi:hypothetical protein
MDHNLARGEFPPPGEKCAGDENEYAYEGGTPNRAWLYPGFPKDLAGQPYYVVRVAN